MSTLGKLGLISTVSFISISAASADTGAAANGEEALLLLSETPMTEEELIDARGGWDFAGFTFNFSFSMTPIQPAPQNEGMFGEDGLFGEEGVFGEGGVFGQQGSDAGGAGTGGDGASQTTTTVAASTSGNGAASSGSGAASTVPASNNTPSSSSSSIPAQSATTTQGSAGGSGQTDVAAAGSGSQAVDVVSVSGPASDTVSSQPHAQTTTAPSGTNIDSQTQTTVAAAPTQSVPASTQDAVPVTDNTTQQTQTSVVTLLPSGPPNPSAPDQPVASEAKAPPPESSGVALEPTFALTLSQKPDPDQGPAPAEHQTLSTNLQREESAEDAAMDIVNLVKGLQSGAGGTVVYSNSADGMHFTQTSELISRIPNYSENINRLIVRSAVSTAITGTRVLTGSSF